MQGPWGAGQGALRGRRGAGPALAWLMLVHCAPRDSPATASGCAARRAKGVVAIQAEGPGPAATSSRRSALRPPRHSAMCGTCAWYTAGPAQGACRPGAGPSACGGPAPPSGPPAARLADAAPASLAAPPWLPAATCACPPASPYTPAPAPAASSSAASAASSSPGSWARSVTGKTPRPRELVERFTNHTAPDGPAAIAARASASVSAVAGTQSRRRGARRAKSCALWWKAARRGAG